MRALIVLSIFTASTSHALPPTEHGRGFRDGANHHLGDDSFVANHHRAPTAGDSEATRMHEHLVYVRELLGARPPTRPELAATRAHLLGALDDYIAAGTTPVNTYVPWRSPVFIDAGGRICAVGYLIERSAGRELAEAIARTHRLSFLEDIAAAMPEARAWVAASGFTLDELASIQPGYNGPEIQYQDGFDPEELEDGPYERRHDGVTITGKVSNHRMTGKWRAVDGNGKVVGIGVFRRGAGTWKSLRPDGSLLAIGAFASNRATGTWKLFHPSGNLAAEGTFRRGKRSGAWRFFHDTRTRTRIAEGQFRKGLTDGTWRHFDARGNLVATARTKQSRDGDSYPLESVLEVVADSHGVVHRVIGGHPASDWRRDEYRFGGETISVEREVTYDARGNQLALEDGRWYATPCKIRPRYDAPEVTDCGERRLVPAARARKITKALAAARRVRAPVPAFMKKYVASMGQNDSTHEDQIDKRDLVSVIAGSMQWFMEWPHVDKPFEALYATLPGYRTNLYGGDAEDAL